MLRVAPLECRNHPRVERLVVGSLGDVPCCRRSLRAAGRLRAEVTEASNRLGWLVHATVSTEETIYAPQVHMRQVSERKTRSKVAGRSAALAARMAACSALSAATSRCSRSKLRWVA